MGGYTKGYGAKAFLSATVAIMVFFACPSVYSDSDKPIPISFSFGNDGSGVVDDVKVVYGKWTFPAGSSHRQYEPLHRVSFTEVKSVHILDLAMVSWTSAGGEKHETTVPIRKLVDDADRLTEMRFFFVDNHVDVYFGYKNKKWPDVTEIELKKVFPTTSR